MFKLPVSFALMFSVGTCLADNIRFNAPEINRSQSHIAVIGDLTGGERAGVFAATIAALGELNPDFILSVGDLIEGGTEDVAQMEKEWASFNSRLSKIDIPFYPVVGNHDISNSAMRHWWEESVGPRYYHFRHGEFLFLMLDSEDFSVHRFAQIRKLRDEAVVVYKEQGAAAFAKTEYSRLDERKYGVISPQQTDYFLDVLKQADNVSWVFVLMHKPLWDSRSSGFADLERALGGFSYTVLNGHEHSYYYEERAGTDHIQMGTSGGEFTPKTRGKYMDHILWITLGEERPAMINLKLEGMLNKSGDPIAGSEFDHGDTKLP